MSDGPVVFFGRELAEGYALLVDETSVLEPHTAVLMELSHPALVLDKLVSEGSAVELRTGVDVFKVTSPASVLLLATDSDTELMSDRGAVPDTFAVGKAETSASLALLNDTLEMDSGAMVALPIDVSLSKVSKSAIRVPFPSDDSLSVKLSLTNVDVPSLTASLTDSLPLAYREVLAHTLLDSTPGVGDICRSTSAARNGVAVIVRWPWLSRLCRRCLCVGMAEETGNTARKTKGFSCISISS